MTESDQLVQRAIGLLMAQRGYTAEQADDLIGDIARRRGRPTDDIAASLLATPRDTASAVRLSRSYQEIGGAIHALPSDLALRRITEITVERVDGASWASLTLYAAGELSTVASTHPSATAVDELQYALGEGPCVSSVTTSSASNLSDNLRSDDRWPTFAARASGEYGVGALLGLRLGLDIDDLNDTVASLNIYATHPEPFTEEAIVIATLIAAHASTAVIASQYQHRVGQLSDALASNREIGVAMGILMHQHLIRREQAFGLLRVASQHTNRKLRDVAVEVADTGVLTLPGEQRAASIPATDPGAAGLGRGSVVPGG